MRIPLARNCSQLNNGYGLEKAIFSTETVKKSMARPLETKAQCALELFAPELIHESRNCSNVHSLPRIPREPLLLQQDVEQRTANFQATIVNEAPAVGTDS
jgi:hypothetical protein